MMAGDIFLARDRHWTTASWAFRWAAEFLAASVNDDAIVARLRVIVDNNLNVIDLDDFQPAERARILDLLQNKLLPDAERRLPTDDFDREGALEILKKLSDMAREVSSH
jgi:hypothetical protein